MGGGKICAGKEDSFVFHHAELIVGEKPAVLDGVDASLNDESGGFASIDVNGNSTARFMGFIDRSEQLFFGIMVGAVVGAKFDQISTVKNIFSHGFADFEGAIGIDVFKEPGLARFRRNTLGLAAIGTDDFS